MPRIDKFDTTYGVSYGGLPSAGSKASDGRMFNNPLHDSSLPPGLFIKGVYVTGYILPETQLGGDPRAAYGFRFLYNPASISQSVQQDNSQQYNPNIGMASLASTQTTSFQLFLNRIPDVTDDIAPIPEGTLHDIDYLYKVVNGPPIDVGGGVMTSDYGYLLPNPCKIVFGRQLVVYGMVTGLSISHQMFQKNMVPVLTTLDINVQRVPPGGGVGSIDQGGLGSQSGRSDAGGGALPGSALNIGNPGGGGYYVGPGGVVMRNFG